MDEAKLVDAALHGSEQAFATLHKTHVPCVRATCRAILRTDDVDDLVQETFLHAFTKLEGFSGHATFRTWITRIALNQCLMALRRNRQVSNGDSQLIDLESAIESSDLLEACVFATEDRELRSVGARMDIPKLLRVLKPLERALLRMAYIEGFPEKDIASRMSMTIPSVKSKLHHAKKRLRAVHKKS